MAGEMNSLGHVWIVHGKPVTPMYDEDVYELIRDNICDDCADYVRERFNIPPEGLLDDLTDAEIISRGFCSGECDKVLKEAEHYTAILHELKDLASEIYHQIVDDWNPGTRRTKKEQLAVDKANQIMNLVNKNT